MKVYRSNITVIDSNIELPAIYSNGYWYDSTNKNKTSLQPEIGNIIRTSSDFATILSVEPNKYYRFDGVGEDGSSPIWTELSDSEALSSGRIEIFNIMEGTYSGIDMGDRSISAQIEFATPIDFQIGDYVEFDIADLIRDVGVEGGHALERFYIYTMPTIKKNASKFSSGKAFEHTVIFYPRQYELASTQMRDIIQEQSSNIIYTGYDEFSFFGGANALMKRIKAVLDEKYGTDGIEGKDYWSYRIADEVNEDENTALEHFQFDFSGNSIMDALLKLNDKDTVNTKFYINERMIYVGFKRPYVCGVDSTNSIKTIPFNFKYGKTSHLPIETNYGNLFSITKSIGSSSPITRLYAYGAARNLHRFYCADRIKSGRYVSKLMLPSFGNDGKTDYIDSINGIAKFGIREGSKTFDEIYPSLRYFTYGDVRKIKYCIKLMGSGLESDEEGVYDSGSTYTYPIARVQCYKIESIPGTMVNQLTPCAPPKDLAVFCHATGKVVKCILYGGNTDEEAIQKQIAHDGVWSNGNGRVPARTFQGTDYIAGSCFAIHDSGYGCGHTHGKYKNGIYDETGEELTRSDWFVNIDSVDDTDNTLSQYKNEVSIHQIVYTDTHWITDIFEFDSYDQQNFVRDGYSAYCWPRINKDYYESNGDNLQLNEVIEVGPVIYEDTDLAEQTQDYFDIFIRDIGFKINEQTWFGDRVFLFDACTVNFLDGNLGGYSFSVLSDSDTPSLSENIVCSINADGSINQNFYETAVDSTQAQSAMYAGAVWRIRCKRSDTDVDNYWMPNININGNSGDHIVLLDIYMPDIYIRVAEQRLLKEAKKYLDANDDGDIQYSFELDKVRLQKTPLFALQMREGAIMRIIDDDLNISTDNEEEVLFNNEAGEETQISVSTEEYDKVYLDQCYLDPSYPASQGNIITLQRKSHQCTMQSHVVDRPELANSMRYVDELSMFDETSNIYEDTYGNLIVYITKEQLRTYGTNGEERTKGSNGWERFDTLPSTYTENDIWRTGEQVLRIHLKEDYKYYKIVSETQYTSEYDTIRVSRDVEVEPYVKLVEWDATRSMYKVTCEMCEDLKPADIRGYLVDYYEPALGVYEIVPYQKVAYTVNQYGKYLQCTSNNLYEFEGDKTYEIVVDVDNVEAWMPYGQNMYLVNGIGNGSVVYFPEYTREVVSGNTYEVSGNRDYIRFKYTFRLPSTFDSSKEYYVAIQYLYNQVSGLDVSDLGMRLVSIIEHNTDENGDKVDYVDLSINNITIKFHDNTRESNVSLQDGVEHERRARNGSSEMYREITATVKEECRASAWSQVMNKIEDNAILAEQNEKSYETLVTASRHSYRNLLALKNNIFDPDGNCSETFLQVMMLQVGADSMNYRMMYTQQGVTGTLSNCEIKHQDVFFESANIYVDTFNVYKDDVLDHYVFTEDEPAGKWYVQGSFSCELVPDVANDGTISYPTYFVAIKCAIHNSQSCEWVCDTNQHSVNELEGYYYFNWGILTADSSGEYSLIETRGNAYMYGDNVICGKISTLAGNSYFDLTHGNFVLSQGGDSSPALSYINGVLTISGIPDASQYQAILTRLGLLENEQVCGENLLPTADYTCEYTVTSPAKFIKLCDIEQNTKYIATYVKFIDNGSSVDEWARGICFGVIKDNAPTAEGDFDAVYSAGEIISATTTNNSLYLIFAYKGYVESVIGGSSRETISSAFTQYLYGLMLQKGEKVTAFQPYIDHLTNAIQGSTQIAGGLLLTNLLMLRDENSKVKAGVSGLTDDYAGETDSTHTHSEGVTLWGGGTYADALKQAQGIIDTLPILLTKTGIGSKIGCMSVTDSGIKISTQEGYIIINNLGIYVYHGSSQYPVISITPGNISIPTDTTSLALPAPQSKTYSTVDGVGNFYLQDSSGNNLSITLPENGMYLKTNGFSFTIKHAAMSNYRQMVDVYFRVNYTGTDYFEQVKLKSITSEWQGAIDETITLDDAFSGMYSTGSYTFSIHVVYSRYWKSWGTIENWEYPSDSIQIEFPSSSAGKIYFYKNAGSPSIQIRRDGVMVSYNSNSYTIFKNDSASNTIIAKGLPTTAPDTSGQIWQNGTQLCITT